MADGGSTARIGRRAVGTLECARALVPCEQWVLANGELVVARRFIADDASLLRAFVRGLSDESRYFRFHGAVAEVPAPVLASLARANGREDAALVVLAVEEGERVQIGEARLAPGDIPGAAEFALAVADRWQGLGIGRRLLQRLESLAMRAGYLTLGGDVLRENRAMLRLAADFGFAPGAYRGDARLVRVAKALRMPAIAARRRPGDTVLT